MVWYILTGIVFFVLILLIILALGKDNLTPFYCIAIVDAIALLILEVILTTQSENGELWPLLLYMIITFFVIIVLTVVVIGKAPQREKRRPLREGRSRAPHEGRRRPPRNSIRNTGVRAVRRSR